MFKSYLKIFLLLTTAIATCNSEKILSEIDKNIMQENPDICFTYLDPELKSILNTINKQYADILSKEMHALCTLVKDDKANVHIVNSETLLILLHDFINIHKPNNKLKNSIEKYLKQHFPDDVLNTCPSLSTLILGKIQQLIKKDMEKTQEIKQLRSKIEELNARLNNK